ncbi:MAG TPA: hypothetical protein VGS41_12610, partial [Chthonomonadales bacterium]|nr:hypothetical protein [Chthonomonadales bacterium]
RPQVCWLGLGGMSLTKANGKPLDGPGLQAVYDQSPGTIAGVVHPVGHGQMAGAGRLLLDVAASKGAKLVVQVEERDGGKYNTFVDLPGDSTVKHLDLAFADFKPAPDSNDSNGTLDMDQVKQVLVLDATGLTGAVDQENTLWVGNVRTAPAK